MQHNNEPATTTRRQLLRTAASAAAAFHIVPRHVLGGSGQVPPSDRINVALVGAGGRGLQNVNALLNLPDAQLIAIADPAAHWDLSSFYYKGVAGRTPVRHRIEQHYQQSRTGYTCSEYEDFRIMLEKEKALDAVLCATPDHLHAVVSLAAMRLGKHVYCEKPLTHNVREARLVADVARQSGVATQMGNQGHSTEGIRLTCEYVWGGAIGRVREVHAWVPASRWNPTLRGKPEDGRPIPDGLNWDLWLGPRASQPFHPAYAPVTWRDFWMFGCGALGDFGCHDLDAACWALDLHHPESVEMHPAGVMDADIAPHGEIGYFQFAARGSHPPLRIVWYSGGLKPPRSEALPDDLPARGVLFVGDEGTLLCGGAGGRPRLFPVERRSAFDPPPPSLPRSQGHHRDWLNAIKGGPPASSNFAYGARLTEITLLGLAALRTGKTLDWNPDTMTSPSVPEAEPILQGTYRPGWDLG